MTIPRWLEKRLFNFRGRKPEAEAALSEDDNLVCAEILVEMEQLFVRHRYDLEVAMVQQLRKSLEARDGSFLGLDSRWLVWGAVGSISDADLHSSGVCKESGHQDQKRLYFLFSRLGRIILKSGVKSERIESLTEWYEKWANKP